MIILKLKNVNFTIPNTESTKYKIIRANKVSFCKKGSKLFNGYKDDQKVKPLWKMPPETRGYSKRFDESKYMSFVKEIVKSEIKVSSIKSIQIFMMMEFKKKFSIVFVYH